MSTDNCCQWFMGLGFAILFFGSVITYFLSKDGNSCTPLLLADLNLLVLFHLLPLLCRVMQRRTKVKIAVWLFSTSLTTIFTWPATITMPLAGKIITWMMVVTSSVGGFYVFFLRSKPRSSHQGHHNSVVCFFFLFVLFISLTITYRGSGVSPSVEQIELEIFEIISCLDSLLLFWSVCVMEIIPLNSANKERMKFAVWGFATALLLMVVSQLNEIFPWPVEIIAWVMATASSLNGFYAFFVQSESYRQDEADATRDFPRVNVLCLA